MGDAAVVSNDVVVRGWDACPGAKPVTIGALLAPIKTLANENAFIFFDVWSAKLFSLG